MPKKTNCLYLQIADTLLEQIKDYTYADGSVLPPERELCEQYRVSRTTIRQAINVLAEKGYLNCIQGKGSIVTHPQIIQELHSVYSFDEDMRRLGRNPETRIMDFVKMLASDAMADTFCLPRGSSVYRIMRLRLADGEPMLLETNYLPCVRFPDISREWLENQSLYHVLTEKYKLNISVADETFEPILLRPMEARLLGSAKDSLGMLVERRSYEDETVVEISKSVSPSCKFKHHVVLQR